MRAMCYLAVQSEAERAQWIRGLMTAITARERAAIIDKAEDEAKGKVDQPGAGNGAAAMACRP